MSKPRFVSSYSYSTLLDSQAPLSGYDLYEDENHRFAVLTFYNNSSIQILSFKVKFVFFDTNNDFLSESVFKVVPQNFYSHRKYTLKDPLVMPKEAKGFNFEIMDVEKASAEQIKREKLKYTVVNNNNLFTKPKNEHFSKRFLLLGSVALLAVASSIVCGFISKASINSGSNGYDDYPTNGGYDSSRYDTSSGLVSGKHQDFDKTDFEGVYYHFENGGWYADGLRDSFKDYISIPETVDGYNVQGISAGAFSGTNINGLSIYLQSGVKFVIQKEAFMGCLKLNYVDLQNVTTIETNAFANCENLEKCVLNYDYSGSVMDYAFDGCKSLTRADIYGKANVSRYAFPDWTQVYYY